MRLGAVVLATLIVAFPGRLGAQERSMSVSLAAMATAAGVLSPGERDARRTFVVDQAARLTLIVTSPVAFEAMLRLADGSTLTSANSDDRRRYFAFGLEETPDLFLPAMGRGHNVFVTITGRRRATWTCGCWQRNRCANALRSP